MTNKKVCARCLKKKPLDQFKVRKGGRQSGRLESYCHPCYRAYFQEYNAKRFASAEAYQQELVRTRERYHRLFKLGRMERKRQLILEMGGRCERCGYNRSAAALDFDHIDPTTKLRTVSHLLAVNRPGLWEAAREEARKCRLLCSNCHRELTYPGHEFSLDPDEFFRTQSQ